MSSTARSRSLYDDAKKPITSETCAHYACGVFKGPGNCSDKERREFTNAVLHFAALGWVIYNGEAELLKPSRAPRKKR